MGGGNQDPLNSLLSLSSFVFGARISVRLDCTLIMLISKRIKIFARGLDSKFPNTGGSFGCHISMSHTGEMVILLCEL